LATGTTGTLFVRCERPRSRQGLRAGRPSGGPDDFVRRFTAVESGLVPRHFWSPPPYCCPYPCPYCILPLSLPFPSLPAGRSPPPPIPATPSSAFAKFLSACPPLLSASHSPTVKTKALLSASHSPTVGEWPCLCLHLQCTVGTWVGATVGRRGVGGGQSLPVSLVTVVSERVLFLLR